MTTVPTAPPKSITPAWLRRRTACADQMALFEATFGAGADLTRANLLRAAAAGLNINWLAAQLLKDPAWAEHERACAPAWAEYERARATAWAEYERARATALAEYERTIATAWAEYGRTIATARAEYGRACAPARAEYERARATALADALGLAADDPTPTPEEARP